MKIYTENVAGKGRGVFAGEKIISGQTIESAPVVEFPREQWKYIEQTEVGYYCFFWGKDNEDGAIVLGMGSLYNHSYNPNAAFVRRLEDRLMDYVALRDIEEGEEITINYNGLTDETPVWFDVIE